MVTVTRGYDETLFFFNESDRDLDYNETLFVENHYKEQVRDRENKVGKKESDKPMEKKESVKPVEKKESDKLTPSFPSGLVFFFFFPFL